MEEKNEGLKSRKKRRAAGDQTKREMWIGE